MAATTDPNEDFSREALTAYLGEDVMAHLDRLAEESPDPHPDELAMLQRIFANAPRHSDTAAASSAEHAA